MIEGRSLDEIPDDVFVALSRRGMEPIAVKECTYNCDGKELTLIDVTSNPKKVQGKGLEPVVEDWLVRCDKCSRQFTIRCKIRYFDGERIDTMVHILDDEEKDLGWLGSY